ncbi:hypothetical protein OsI_28481 [Oryza sativa Indica Group]|uniref:DC1 domain-containing protein n=1 Tax=Oryza sativa subsp. indica TaxID=39946 RepID=A2YT31_ORYSI|nr:hypothetical protein OsI_28481 [Oryza sativa Indica Group]
MVPAEVMHPARPGCMLRLVHGDTGGAMTNFQCDGCREPGKGGPRYTSGDLVLHTSCARAAPALQHQLVEGVMELRLVAPAGGGVCSACYDTVRGFHYYCSRRTSKGEHPKLHPGCAKLPVSMALQSGDAFELRTEVSHRCTSCREMEGFYRPWCYRSTNPEQRMYLHVKCIEEIQDEAEERMMVRLRERADRNVRMERRVSKTLVIMVRIVFMQAAHRGPDTDTHRRSERHRLHGDAVARP